MTQYVQILYTTLGLNILAIAYRCQARRRLKELIVGAGRRRTHEAHSKRDSAALLETGGNGVGHETAPIINNGHAHSQPQDREGNTDMARRHRHLLYRIYLPVYLLACAADWLQGPYKYAVYSAYGYTQHDISILFVAGFGSGLSLGSIIGGLADTWGRKRMTLAYCVCYTFSCLAKHFQPFWVLLLGRVLGGIATSLLFSVFDAWLIRAHTLRRIDKSFLSDSFSAANFGSSVVAIVSGLWANSVVGTTAESGKMSNLQPAFEAAAQTWSIQEAEASQHGEEAIGPPKTSDDRRWQTAWVYVGGGIAAFDLALVPLALCFLLALAFWEENYGEDCDDPNVIAEGQTVDSPRKEHKREVKMFSALRKASLSVWRSPGIFNLCIVSSFFEGSMYVFILLWTPALRALDVVNEEEGYPGPPLGLVFATFMVCCMFGTSIFAILASAGVCPSKFLVAVLMCSAGSCLIMSQATNSTILYMAMLLFEACIGAYYPAMSTVKGSIVPEDQRAAIYSVFRLPLNLVVLMNLISDLRFDISFAVCSAMLSLSTVLQLRVAIWEKATAPQPTSPEHDQAALKQKRFVVQDEGTIEEELCPSKLLQYSPAHRRSAKSHR